MDRKDFKGWSINLRENSDLLKGLFDRTFFKSWRMPRGESLMGYQGIELEISPDCNLNCKYCYMAKHRSGLYPEHINNNETILKNVGLVIDWLIENRYTPPIDFFSGSPFSQQVCLDALELIYEKYAKVPLELRTPSIVVPSNFTFLMDEALTQRVENFIAKYNSIGIRLILSASFDGKHMEKNRPLRKHAKEGVLLTGKDTRDDAYYERAFEFCKKYNFGFHPMIYSEGIEDWKENFLWFQKNFQKHGINFDNIYLLEVRNEEWSEKQIADYLDFLKFMIKWTFYEPCNQSKERFKRFFFNSRGYNILVSNLFTRSRGTSCSIQTLLYVRMGDLAIIPCHRLSYDGFEFGKFIVENDTIIDIEAINTELACTISTMELSQQPMCQDCIISPICCGGCLGSQFESNGEIFMPIPTVCTLLHKKIFTILSTFKEIGVYDIIMDAIPEDLRQIYEEVLQLGGYMNE